MLRPNDQPHDEHPIIIKECDDNNTSQREQIDIIPFGFVSSDEPPSLHGSVPITPARSALLLHDSFSRSSNSPFKIPIVNCGSTPAQLHELKQKSRPLPDNSEIGSRPGFSATPGPKQHGNGYGLFDSNSKENDIIYSSIKNSERNHPSSPDTRDIPHFKFMLNFMDSPEPVPSIATRVDDGDRNGEDDETYHRGKVLFTDDPLSSRPDPSSRIVDPRSSDMQIWQPSPSNVWQRDKDSINLQEPAFLPNRKITQPSNIVESFIRTSEFIGTDSNIFLPTSSAEVIIDGRNSNLNRNKWNRNRNSHDRSEIGSSLDSDVSLSFRKMGISVDTVRISNDSSKNANKQDFMESPRSKNAIKEFNNKFRFFAKSSFVEAEDFANKEVLLMPDHAKWRVFVELAELAKKNNDADKARMYYVKACGLEKRASTTWLEWSKLEEENGRPLEALKVLKIGLGICKLNDTLLPRSIKLHERLCLHEEIREFLATLRQEPLERTWKSILEGCMFEARIGNYSRARDIYKFLMSYVPWYGPIYFEAFRLEEREGNDVQALAIIKSGLKELPRYGPLWFGLMRIMERRDIKVERRFWYIGESPKLEELSRECDEAVKSISKELTWRVHYERFQAEERASEVAAWGLFKQTSRWSILECRRFMLSGCRKSLTQSLLLCPSNLRWKLFLVGARLELGLGNIVTARDLIQRSFQEVPSKSKASVYIECSRLEEYIKNFEVARSILSFAKTELQNDWRLCLESILLEARRGNMSVAVELAREAVAIHPGTGRIWALYIQLNHRWESSAEFLLKKKSHMTKLVDYLMDFPEPEGNNYSQKFNDVTTITPKNLIVRKAIMEVPKSGEVWCEEGRCRLNPFLLHDFDLGSAQKSLSFAIQFTPQYGDTFIEYLRLELICHVILKFICQEVLFIPFCSFIKEILIHDHESDLYYQTFENSASSASNNFSRFTRRKMMRDILELKYDFEKKLDPSGHYEFPQLLRRCVNADPNYGSAWFHCRELPFDIPTHIMANAQRVIRQEIESSRLLYGRAVLLYVRKALQSKIELVGNADLPQFGQKFVQELMEDFQYCDHMLCLPERNLQRITQVGTELVGPLILEVEDSLFSLSDFTTGIIDLNRSVFNPHNPEEIRRRYLFGIDQIVS